MMIKNARSPWPARVLIGLISFGLIGCDPPDNDPASVVRRDDDVLLTKLLDEGLDPNLTAQLTGHSLLHTAAGSGAVKSIRILVSRGARLESVHKGGFTPLHSAIALRQVEAAKLLISLGSNTKAVTQRGVTPRELATSEGLSELLPLL